jgi:hypothetical protein
MLCRNFANRTFVVGVYSVTILDRVSWYTKRIHLNFDDVAVITKLSICKLVYKTQRMVHVSSGRPDKLARCLTQPGLFDHSV